jgi:hypothetical protein
MKWIRVAAAAAVSVAGCDGASARPPLHDPVQLNIGVNCQWQPRCMAEQRTAMRRALAYVSSRRPPSWRVQLCNRNAARGGYRVDWVGYDNCIRNASLRRSSRVGARSASR